MYSSICPCRHSKVRKVASPILLWVTSKSSLASQAEKKSTCPKMASCCSFGNTRRAITHCAMRDPGQTAWKHNNGSSPKVLHPANQANAIRITTPAIRRSSSYLVIILVANNTKLDFHFRR
jgi:hypothetical protein